jgi:VWFA-related protein
VAFVRTDVLVTDRNRIVADLTAEDFTITDEGQPQKIVYFGRESEPLSLLLLLDVSGSMRKYLEPMVATARQALNHLEPGDRVAIMIFGRTSKVWEEFGDNHALIARELNAAVQDDSQGSATAINAAIVDAAGYIGRAPDYPGKGRGRRAVLIVTDNRGLNYQEPDEKAIRALYSADAVLNAVVVGKGDRPAAPRPGGYVNPDFTPPDVFKIAEETGGEAVKSEKAAEAFREMIERIRTRYAIHYSAPEAAAGTYRRIKVELSAAARQRYPRAQVRSRSGYFVP